MNDVLKQAYDLNQKIIEETHAALSTGANLLDELLQECIDFKALIYLQHNTQLSFSFQHNHLNQSDIISNDHSRLSEAHQYPKKTKIFLSKKVKRTTKSTENTTTKKALKNNKIVYCHSDISTKESKHIIDKDNQESLQSITSSNQCPSQSPLKSLFQKKNRGSIYRGVSRNGNQWQVLIMINKKKRYIGSYSNELEAAKAYDVVALQNHKRKAKTNFYYSEDERREIISSIIYGK